jgi:hypothetical protein
MTREELQRLLESDVVRPVEVDRDAAGRDLAASRVHLESAGLLAASDPTGGFVMAYDATRKAIAAHMRAQGLRVGKGPGEHQRTAKYAIAALAPGLSEHLDALDEMRRLRHQSEYGARLIRPDELEVALVHATAIVAAVERDLP